MIFFSLGHSSNKIQNTLKFQIIEFLINQVLLYHIKLGRV
jgi:hypothetical protein